MAILCSWPEQRAAYAAHIRGYLHLKHKHGTLETYTVNIWNTSVGNNNKLVVGRMLGLHQPGVDLTSFLLGEEHREWFERAAGVADAP